MRIQHRRNETSKGGANAARKVAALACVIGLTGVFAVTAVAQDRPVLLTTILKQSDLSELVAEAIRHGDADRGKLVFHRDKLGCVKCHVASPGSMRQGLRTIGPDQRSVGDRLRPEQIVEAVLFPSRSIAKGYESFVVLTVDGETHKGVPIRESKQEVVLLDPEKNEPVTIARMDIEAMREAGSAMPDGIVDQLASRREFDDLIRYLIDQKASLTGTPVVATEDVVVREVSHDGRELPWLAVARPDGICYAYDPNQFRLESIWRGPLGWQQEDGLFIMNLAAGESFHIRDKPWKIDVGRGQFDFKWLGYDVTESGVLLRYSLTEKARGKPLNAVKRREWMVEESIEIPSLSQQRLRFRITHPEGANEVLTYWLRQTNFRSVTSNGQQAQRDQLEFLKPRQSDFLLELTRRKSGKTIPRGYSVTRLAGPTPPKPQLFEPTGFDFAEDGTAFVSTRTGGIWRYHNDQWNLFAEGLHETQGVRIARNGRDVYTMQKPELTLLRDTDNDGVADVYSSVESRFRFTGNYHEFAYGPVMSSVGDLFFSTGLSASGNHEAKKSGTGQMSSALGYRGWVMKIDTAGTLKPFASGLRSPAGIGINDNDELFITDNQGDWVASSYLGHVEAGDFLGHPAALWDREEYGITPPLLDYTTVDARVAKVPELDEVKYRAERKRPAVWLIHGDLTNSPGNPSFCPPNGFGPFSGQAFIADISHRAIVRVALQKVNGVYQGAVFPFIRPLASASFSTAFDSRGRLWVGSVGRGWTAGDPMIEVISYDATQPAFEMHRIELMPYGFDVHFTQPLSDAVIPREQIVIRQFHYLYWAEYGSDRQDNTRVPVQRLALSPDRQTLSINVPVAKDNVYEIDLGNLQSIGGIELQNHFAFYTLNELVK